MELLRLRVKNVDFARNQIVVRAGKGAKDRVRAISEKDAREKCAGVSLSDGVGRKFPNAGREWASQYVFHASNLSREPGSSRRLRHHLQEDNLQRAMKATVA